jgi:hypothetical protein
MTRFSFLAFALCAMLVSASAFADVFSIRNGSPSDDFAGSDVLNAGPQVHVGYATLDGTTLDDIDALSGGLDSVDGSDVIYFSVDEQSQGVNFGGFTETVNGQAALNQQAGDIYVTVDITGTEAVPGSGYALLMKNQNRLGLQPKGTFVFDPQNSIAYDNTSGAQDDLDAYSQEEFDVFLNDRVPDRPLFFSASSSSPSLSGGSGADILVYDPQSDSVETFATAAMLGLAQSDDIDALALNLAVDYQTGDVIGGMMYLSLTPGNSLGVSGADVLAVNFIYNDTLDVLSSLGGAYVYYSHADLGLLETDNIDALETNAYIPEPTTLALIGLSGLAMLRRKA